MAVQMGAGQSGTATPSPRKVDLVFDGGGVWGVALVGALDVLERNGYQPQNVAGTSAGAIVAALVAAGYTAEEIHQLQLREPLGKLLDATWQSRVPLIGIPLSILTTGGINKGDRLLKRMRTVLKARGVRTFGDLVIPEFADQPRYRYKLQVIASDLTERRMLVLPRDAHVLGVQPDDLEVALALRMSASIPLFFKPVLFRNPKTRQVHVITDGGMLSSFPIFLFDSEGTPEWPTFGLRLVEQDPNVPPAMRIPPAVGSGGGLKAVINLLTSLVHTLIEAHDRAYLETATFARTITIPTLGIPGTDFNATQEQFAALYRSGQDAATRFLSTWDFQNYIAMFRSGKPEVRRRQELAAAMQRTKG